MLGVDQATKSSLFDNEEEWLERGLVWQAFVGCVGPNLYHQYVLPSMEKYMHFNIPCTAGQVSHTQFVHYPSSVLCKVESICANVEQYKRWYVYGSQRV